VKGETGVEFSVKNPPDSFFEEEQLKALARLFLVGYDESMCPDGEVVGKALSGTTDFNTMEEKAAFMKASSRRDRGEKDTHS